MNGLSAPSRKHFLGPSQLIQNYSDKDISLPQPIKNAGAISDYNFNFFRVAKDCLRRIGCLNYNNSVAEYVT